MTREAQQESLSAVMDNEADELELRRVLSACDDAEVRATWSRYQIARAVMHKELLEPRLDIAAVVSAALAGEAIPGQPSRALGRVVVAASVTLAVLAGVRFYNNQDELQLAQQFLPPSDLIMPQVQGPAVLAGYSTNAGSMLSQRAVNPSGSGWYEQRLPGYLRQHAQGGADSALPYARAASLENR